MSNVIDERIDGIEERLESEIMGREHSQETMSRSLDFRFDQIRRDIDSLRYEVDSLRRDIQSVRDGINRGY